MRGASGMHLYIIRRRVETTIGMPEVWIQFARRVPRFQPLARKVKSHEHTNIQPTDGSARPHAKPKRSIVEYSQSGELRQYVIKT